MQIRRQGDASGLEEAADLTGDGGAGGDALAVFLNRRFLEAVEIAQQIAVAQHGLQWRDPGVCAQYEEAVVARLLGELAGIDLEAGRGLPVALGVRRR